MQALFFADLIHGLIRDKYQILDFLNLQSQLVFITGKCWHSVLHFKFALVLAFSVLVLVTKNVFLIFIFRLAVLKLHFVLFLHFECFLLLNLRRRLHMDLLMFSCFDRLGFVRFFLLCADFMRFFLAC